MEYKVELVVNNSKDVVSNNYLNKENMFKWMSNLTDIKSLNGSLFEENSSGLLIFDNMEMMVSVNRLDLPNLIVTTYQLGKVINRTINHFFDFEGKTLWVMEVTFDFNIKIDVDESVFRNKTLESMKLYKNFIEGINE